MRRRRSRSRRRSHWESQIRLALVPELPRSVFSGSLPKEAKRAGAKSAARVLEHNVSGFGEGVQLRLRVGNSESCRARRRAKCILWSPHHPPQKHSDRLIARDTVTIGRLTTNADGRKSRAPACGARAPAPRSQKIPWKRDPSGRRPSTNNRCGFRARVQGREPPL